MTDPIKPRDGGEPKLKPSERFHKMLQGRTYEEAKQSVFRDLQLQILDELHERRAYLDEQHAAGRGAPKRFETVCPCTLAGPCEPNCTCANPVLSGGCRCCATYGDADQRQGMAEYIFELLRAGFAATKAAPIAEPPSPVAGEPPDRTMGLDAKYWESVCRQRTEQLDALTEEHKAYRVEGQRIVEALKKAYDDNLAEALTKNTQLEADLLRVRGELAEVKAQRDSAEHMLEIEPEDKTSPGCHLCGRDGDEAPCVESLCIDCANWWRKRVKASDVTGRRSELTKSAAPLGGSTGEAPVYPSVVNGQNVMQPTPSVMLEVAPSGFAERILFGQPRHEGWRAIKYVLAPPDEAPAVTEPPAPERCPCTRCGGGKVDGHPFAQTMVLCPRCGNKRCPKAEWHGFRCSGSNDLNQVGVEEIVEPQPPPADQPAPDMARMRVDAAMRGDVVERAPYLPKPGERVRVLEVHPIDANRVKPGDILTAYSYAQAPPGKGEQFKGMTLVYDTRLVVGAWCRVEPVSDPPPAGDTERKT